MQRAHRLIQRRHPAFRTQVHEFIRADPIAAARARVIAALPSTRIAGVRVRQNGCFIWFMAGRRGPMGAASCTRTRLAQQQARQREVAVYSRFADADRVLGEAVEHLDHGVRVRLIVNNFTQRNPFSRNGLHCGRIARDFGRYLDEVRPAVLHVHHLAGHCASLLSVARRRGIPISIRRRTGGPCVPGSTSSIAATRSVPGQSLPSARAVFPTNLPPATIASAVLHRARRMWIRAQLAHVDAVVMGSQFIADSYRRWQVIPSTVRVHVVPYGVPMREAPSTPGGKTRTLPLRFGYIGALLPHKGVHVCIEAFRHLNPGLVELHVWGLSEDSGVRRVTRVERGGHAPHPFPWRISRGREGGHPALDRRPPRAVDRPANSFGIVAREATAQGVPVLASRRGALADLFAEDEGGALFAPDDPVDLARHVTRVIDDPDLLDRWRRSVPPVKSIERHAQEIDELDQTLVPRSVVSGSV